MTSAADTLLPHRAAREWPETLVIGGAGAIGSRLIAALVARDGPGTVLAGLRRSALPPDLAEKTVCEFGVDVRDAESVRALIDKYRRERKSCSLVLACYVLEEDDTCTSTPQNVSQAVFVSSRLVSAGTDTR